MNKSESGAGNWEDRAEPAGGGRCGCGSGGCGGPGQGLSRREFIHRSGAGFMATSLGRYLPPMAGPFAAGDLERNHLVPADKNLDPAWVRGLFERGEKEVFSGDALLHVGMPCGGIGAGQLYLRGDGALGCWMIFNDAVSNWVAETHSTYEHTDIDQSVEQGFAVAVEEGDRWGWRRLNRDGFADVTFKGEYPIGTVSYGAAGSPVAVEMEAFSPFIPLNAADSSLPATVFNITVRNTSESPRRVFLSGWLQNAVANKHGAQLRAQRVTRVETGLGRAYVLHSARREPGSAAATEIRPAIQFETFEAPDYGAWTVEGNAFGPEPARGALPGQNPVSGFEGEGLVNTFFEGDGATGKLTSPVFTVPRRYVNFLVGGGAHAEKTCINLLVDGEVVRTATGSNNEQLAWQSWEVAAFESKDARIEIVDEATGPWGHINIDQIEFADEPRTSAPHVLEEAPDFGTMALVCTLPAAAHEPLYPAMPEQTFMKDGEAAYGMDPVRCGYIRTEAVALPPGEERVFTFVLAWHFPNRSPKGHFYAGRFGSARDVANYCLDEHERLAAHTRLWRDIYYDSTLPFWLLDRLHSTAANLATGTCQYWGDGRFWAWEGVACCEGTCTHVWNYAHTHARLFPELARSVREMQDFQDVAKGGGFNPDTGLVGFRSNDAYAADGQCGTILKAYREHLMSADPQFLSRNWPRIRKALEYAIGQDRLGRTGGAPGEPDGIIENTQHNTYDINYEGANTFVGALYLAALRAGEAMAREAGDTEFEAVARGLFESGSRYTVEHLWNGEYFVQDVDLEQYPKHQYRDGCLSDHLFGQGWAHQLGLGYLYPQEHVRTALRSIWKYNWAPDVAPYNDVHPPFRWFITPGQAGLFTCTWPKSDFLAEGTLYRSEVWTGIEYQVAGHMAWEGMLEEALVICRAVHDRHHPDLRNPYNEVECGDHYARALASWGVYLALMGFACHGPRGRLGFAPRISPERFRAAFTTAEGWGVFSQERIPRRQINRIMSRWGTVRVNALDLALPEGAKPVHIVTRVDGEAVHAHADIAPGRISLLFPDSLNLRVGSEVEALTEY